MLYLRKRGYMLAVGLLDETTVIVTLLKPERLQTMHTMC